MRIIATTLPPVECVKWAAFCWSAATTTSTLVIPLLGLRTLKPLTKQQAARLHFIQIMARPTHYQCRVDTIHPPQREAPVVFTTEHANYWVKRAAPDGSR